MTQKKAEVLYYILFALVCMGKVSSQASVPRSNNKLNSKPLTAEKDGVKVHLYQLDTYTRTGSDGVPWGWCTGELPSIIFEKSLKS